MRLGLIIIIAFGLISAARAEPAVPGASGVTGDAAARLLAVQTVLQATTGADSSPLSAGGPAPGPQGQASATPGWAPPLHSGGVTPTQRFLPLHPQARAFPVPPRGATAVPAQAVRAMAMGSTSGRDLGRTALAAASAPPPAAAALAQLQNYAPSHINRMAGSAETYEASARANAAVVEAMHQYRLTHKVLDVPTPR